MKTETLPGPIIEFTPVEMQSIAYYGVDRRIDSLAKKRKGAHGFDREYEAWSIDIEGCMGEAAVAAGLGVVYAPVIGTLDTERGDVVHGVQVRTTRYGFDRAGVGCLLLHDSDSDSDRFVLACGSNGTYRLAGWIQGIHGKQQAFIKHNKGRWAYWVPQSALQPFSSLAKQLSREALKP